MYKRTFFISAMISLGSLDEVVFMLHVNLKDLGLTSVPSFTALLFQKKERKKKKITITLNMLLIKKILFVSYWAAASCSKLGVPKEAL